MSAKYTFLAWGTNIESAPLKLALLQLANNADDDGFSYYSISKMAKSCGVSDRTFIRKIAELERLNILTVERRSNRPSLYTLQGDEMGVTLCQLQNSEVTECHAEVTECHGGGDRVSHDLNNTPNTTLNNIYIPPEAKAPNYSTVDYEFAEYAKNLISRVATKQKVNLGSWAETIRLMREVDKLDHKDIDEVLKWANADSFWSTNILSMAKLRKQFSQLHAKMTRSKNGQINGNNASPSKKLSAYERQRERNAVYRNEQPNECELGLGANDRHLRGAVGEREGGTTVNNVGDGTFVDY